MEKRFTLIFDEVMLSQMKKLGSDANTRTRLSKMFDKLELLGPAAGKLIDSRLFLYELKSKHPPIRLYFHHNNTTNELYVFEYEMKRGEQKQQATIHKLKEKLGGFRNQYRLS